jgi:hypothetical protein
VRPTCLRCLRPAAFCLCEALPPVETRTRVVLLQHPREARLAICSAWLTRLALGNSEIHRGVRFGDHPRVREVAGAPGAALLYPGAGAVPAGSLAARPPEVLVVLDGTWHQADRMLRDNPPLAALPRVSVVAERPSGYGELRREPSPECLSTLEAVALALEAIEGAPGRFEPMREAFRRMVDRQLACARDARRNPRHRRGSAAA